MVNCSQVFSGAYENITVLSFRKFWQEEGSRAEEFLRSNQMTKGFSPPLRRVSLGCEGGQTCAFKEMFKSKERKQENVQPRADQHCGPACSLEMGQHREVVLNFKMKQNVSGQGF